MVEGDPEIAFSDHTIRLTHGDGLFIPGGEESKHKAASLTPVARVLLVDEADSAWPKTGFPVFLRDFSQQLQGL